MVVAGAVFRCVGRLSDYVCDSRRARYDSGHDAFPVLQDREFRSSFFAGRYGYNHLMLSAEFYRRFLNWEYILIYQTDAFVFRDELAQWCAPGDMVPVGAPWLFLCSAVSCQSGIIKYVPQPKSLLSGKNHYQRHIVRNKVGNGGLSLRRTGTIYRLLTDHADRVAYYKERVAESRYHEDVFFAVEAPKLEPNFSLPPVEVAAHFSIRYLPLALLSVERRACPVWLPWIQQATAGPLLEPDHSRFHGSRPGRLASRRKFRFPLLPGSVCITVWYAGCCVFSGWEPEGGF